MRIIVCGGRDFADEEWLFDALDRMHSRRRITFLRQGGQRKKHPTVKDAFVGADWFAKRWAISRGVPNDEVRADWDRFGAAAGPIRNGMMIRDGDIDRLVEFPGGDGTADMVKKAYAANIKVSTMIRPLDREEKRVAPAPVEPAPPPAPRPPKPGQMSLI